jgi:amino acid permease
MATLGIFGGILVISFAGLTSGFGLFLLTRCAKYVEDGKASFFQLSKRTYPSAAIFFDLAIALKTFGVAVSYLIIISNLMPQIIHAAMPSAQDSDYLMDRRFWLTVFMIIIIPLSFLRRLDSLKYTSVVSLFAIGYLVLLVVGHWITGDTLPDRGVVKLFEWKGFIKFLNSLPVFGSRFLRANKR